MPTNFIRHCLAQAKRAHELALRMGTNVTQTRKAFAFWFQIARANHVI